MDTIRKVTPTFDMEFEKWANRTKRLNGFPLNTDASGNHRTVRKTLMEILSKKMQLAPPVKISKKGKPNQFKMEKFKFEGLI